jgi:hypothetical protein
MAIDPRLQQGQPQSNRVKNMQDLQDIAQSRTLIDDRQKIQDMSSKLPTSSSGISKVLLHNLWYLSYNATTA